MLKTIVHTGPGPTFKGVVRGGESRFETEWLNTRAEALALCQEFTRQCAQVSSAPTSQSSKEKRWDF